MAHLVFKANGLRIEFHGEESFIERQLRSLASGIGGNVDAIDAPAPARRQERVPEPTGEADLSGLVAWLHQGTPLDPRSQEDAALRFCDYLQNVLGRPSVRLGELLRCCVVVGVDSKRFHNALDELAGKGLLEKGAGVYRLASVQSLAVERASDLASPQGAREGRVRNAED